MSLLQNTRNYGDGELVEKIIIDNGIKVFLAGHAMPLRGMPTAEAVHAIAIIKKLAIYFATSPMCILFFTRSLERFTALAYLAIEPYVMKAEHMTPCARALRESLAVVCDERLAIVLSHVVEYDNAYRFRLQDMLAATTVGGLRGNFFGSIDEMLLRNRLHDYRKLHDKVRYAAHLLKIALLYPPFRGRWKKFWYHVNFQHLLPDEIDLYWINLRTDYGPNNPNRYDE